MKIMNIKLAVLAGFILTFISRVLFRESEKLEMNNPSKPTTKTLDKNKNLW